MKKKKIAKSMALLMATMMFVTGCGKTEVDNDQTSTGASESTAASETTVEPVVKNYWEMLDEVSDTSELPDWTGDTLEVSIWVAGGNDYVFGSISDTNVTFKELERVTGIKFVVDDCYGNGGDSIDAKMPKIVASKEYPTIVWGWNVMSQMNTLYDNGLLADLTEYYENGDLDQLLKWAPLEEMEELLYSKMRAEDGSLFLLPAVSNMTGYWDTTGYYPEGYDPTWWASLANPQDPSGLYTINGIWVRDDIIQALYPEAMSYQDIVDTYLEKGTFTEEQIYDLGLNSAEDFYELLRDIKELISSGDYVGLDGREMEVTYGPNADSDNWEWMTSLPKVLKGFSINTNYFVTGDRTAKDGNLLVNAYSSDEYVDFMKELNALVLDDVIAQNSLVDNAASWDEKILNGHYAVTYGSLNTRPDNIDGSEGGWAYRPIWVKHDSDMTYGGFGSVATVQNFGIFKDTLTDEQMDQLIHALNYLYSPVGINNFYWGPESAGLFTVDENGVRSYTDPEVEAAMIFNEDNGAPLKYGLVNSAMSEPSFCVLAMNNMGSLTLGPRNLNFDKLPKDAKMAVGRFNPGLLEGMSVSVNQVRVNSTCNMYSGAALAIPGNKQFWDAREGFENQMKKTIVAKDFDVELQKLIKYAEDNGLTAETTKAWNDLWIEANRVPLEAVGLLD